MNILVFNCGSSSQNFKVYSVDFNGKLDVLFRGKAHRVGVYGQEPSFIEFHAPELDKKEVVPLPDHRCAADLILDMLSGESIQVDVIGHRFVHGGSLFNKSVFLTPENEDQIRACLPLAPIHNPNSMSVIERCAQRMPHVPQYLTFDTTFHSEMPEFSYRYALPERISNRFGLRKFGFHGLSYQYVSRRAAEFLGRELDEIDMVACHLGTGGSSVAAIQKGKSLDTSMGYSPLAGLVMSTRPGDLDGIVSTYLMRTQALDGAALNDLYNKKSGLIGLSGISSDLRDIQHAAQGEGDIQAAFAAAVYTGRLIKTIAAFTTLMGGVDALVFIDDIGAGNAPLRERVCFALEWAGFRLDREKNAAAAPDQICEIGRVDSRVCILSVPTDEERVIADEGYRLMQRGLHVDL